MIKILIIKNLVCVFRYFHNTLKRWIPWQNCQINTFLCINILLVYEKMRKITSTLQLYATFVEYLHKRHLIKSHMWLLLIPTLKSSRAWSTYVCMFIYVHNVHTIYYEACFLLPPWSVAKTVNMGIVKCSPV